MLRLAYLLFSIQYFYIEGIIPLFQYDGYSKRQDNVILFILQTSIQSHINCYIL